LNTSSSTASAYDEPSASVTGVQVVPSVEVSIAQPLPAGTAMPPPSSYQRIRLELRRTGSSQAYWMVAARSGERPLRCWPKVPQPNPGPLGFEPAGALSSLTTCGFSQGEEPDVVIVAVRARSTTVSRGSRVIVMSLLVLSAPSVAVIRTT
jgi:hypothetical protein